MAKSRKSRRKYVTVRLHGTAQLLKLIEEAGQFSTLTTALGGAHATARITTHAYNALKDIALAAPALKDNARLKDILTGCDPTTDPDCIGF